MCVCVCACVRACVCVCVHLWSILLSVLLIEILREAQATTFREGINELFLTDTQNSQSNPGHYILNSSYYHHQIGSINLSHCCNIFPWLCLWGGCTSICSRFHTHTPFWIYLCDVRIKSRDKDDKWHIKIASHLYLYTSVSGMILLATV